MGERLDTFPRLLLHHAHTRPDAPATREKDLGIWQTWTWRQVADEVRALACGLAISAGLAVRSLINLLQTDLGFEPRNLIAVRIDPAVDGSQVNYLEGLLDHVRALPAQ